MVSELESGDIDPEVVIIGTPFPLFSPKGTIADRLQDRFPKNFPADYPTRFYSEIDLSDQNLHQRTKIMVSAGNLPHLPGKGVIVNPFSTEPSPLNLTVELSYASEVPTEVRRFLERMQLQLLFPSYPPLVAQLRISHDAKVGYFLFLPPTKQVYLPSNFESLKQIKANLLPRKKFWIF